MTGSGHGAYPAERHCRRCGNTWVLMVDRPERQVVKPGTCQPCRTRRAQDAARLAAVANAKIDLDRGWVQSAACAGHPDPELWHPASVATDVTEPLEVCLGCPVRADCLATALASTPPVQGIWGGLTEDERTTLRRRQQRRRQREDQHDQALEGATA